MTLIRLAFDLLPRRRAIGDFVAACCRPPDSTFRPGAPLDNL